MFGIYVTSITVKMRNDNLNNVRNIMNIYWYLFSIQVVECLRQFRILAVSLGIFN
jgi:hypothetical protein